MKTHSSAFDGLLSLIPAKYYYDDATSDQWQQKKKSKKDAAKDRLAKLDPDSASSADSYNTGSASAKDVMANLEKSAQKARIPGQKPEEESNSLEEMNLQEVSMEFNDDGDEVGAEQAPLQPQSARPSKKKQLTAEEAKLREQRRAELKEKLAKKINNMREKRKAPGSKTGAPAKSREQMLAERKHKEELKRQAKLKRKREQEEDEDDAESDKSEDDEDEEDGEEEVLFGNIQFKDGSRMTSDLQKIRQGVEHKKKKGPSNNDFKAHLQRLTSKKRKLEQLSPEERKKAESQDQWRSLMDQAQGVKVKNDEKLLKKAIKRKEKQKLRSEVEWKERKQVVADTSAARQKRREANLKARRESKGKKGKNQPRLKKFTGVVQKSKGKGGKDGKKRAGFEGNAKAKAKSKK